MDIRVPQPEADAMERAAVDSVLGPPAPVRAADAREQDAATSGTPGTRGRRDLLLPALHGVEARFGWLPPGALNHISRRLTIPPAEVYGVATFYHLFSLTPRSPRLIHVCDDIACRIRGAGRLCSDLETTLGPEGTADSEKPVAWKRSPCLGHCERAPATLMVSAGANPQMSSHAPAETGNDLVRAFEAPAVEEDRLETLRRSVPQSGQPGLRLLSRIGRTDPESLQAYRGEGGYRALGRAIELGPKGVIAEVVASKLLGRGGAAFPTGRKWEAVAHASRSPHYVVCNADESEPGTFKDRLLMEGDPFAILEGMTIAAFATRSERGYLYIRGEYPLAARRMTTAIEAARGAGLLGQDILGSGLDFDIEIRRGAGAYVCGEETALFNSIEGKRGEPRNKPPFPVDVGLFGKPTLVNNVETLANVPWIVTEGGDSFSGVGTSESAGSKLYCVSGHVARPGLYEVPFGRTLGEVIELAGGVRGARDIRAVLLGGAAGTFVGPDKMSMPLTFEGTRSEGASVGSGVVMVLDDTVDIGDILARIAAFFRDETCGQCVPCRVGTVRQEELLARVRTGRTIGGRSDELALLADIGQVMRDASICGLGQTASNAIESAFQSLDPVPERSTKA